MATPAYSAPEMVDGAAPTLASDVWSFGIMLYEMVTGKHPFADMHWAVMMTGLLDGTLDVEWPEDMERYFRRLCESCVEKDPSRRPTADVICKASIGLSSA